MIDRSLAIVVLSAGSIVAGLVDWIAVAARWPWYYRNGICIYRKTVQVPNTRGIQVLTDTLNERFASQHSTSTELWDLCPGDWAIRVAGSSVIMHGRLLVDPANGRVTVLGYADWATIWVSLALVGIVIGVQQIAGTVLALVVAVGLLVSYTFRAKRYEEVIQYAADRLVNPIVEGPERA